MLRWAERGTWWALCMPLLHSLWGNSVSFLHCLLSQPPPTTANQEGVCVVWIWGKDAPSWLLSPIHLEGGWRPQTPAVWASYHWVITVLLLAMDGLDSHSPSGPSGCQTKRGGCSDFSVRSFCSVADNPEVEIALNVSKAG